MAAEQYYTFEAGNLSPGHKNAYEDELDAWDSEEWNAIILKGKEPTLRKMRVNPEQYRQAEGDLPEIVYVIDETQAARERYMDTVTGRKPREGKMRWHSWRHESLERWVERGCPAHQAPEYPLPAPLADLGIGKAATVMKLKALHFLLAWRFSTFGEVHGYREMTVPTGSLAAYLETTHARAGQVLKQLAELEVTLNVTGLRNGQEAVTTRAITALDTAQRGQAKILLAKPILDELTRDKKPFFFYTDLGSIRALRTVHGLSLAGRVRYVSVYGKRLEKEDGASSMRFSALPKQAIIDVMNVSPAPGEPQSPSKVKRAFEAAMADLEQAGIIQHSASSIMKNGETRFMIEPCKRHLFYVEARGDRRPFSMPVKVKKGLRVSQMDFIRVAQAAGLEITEYVAEMVHRSWAIHLWETRSDSKEAYGGFMTRVLEEGKLPSELRHYSAAEMQEVAVHFNEVCREGGRVTRAPEGPEARRRELYMKKKDPAFGTEKAAS